MATPSVRKALGDVSNSNKTNISLNTPASKSVLLEKQQPQSAKPKPFKAETIKQSLAAATATITSTASSTQMKSSRVEDIEYAPMEFVEPELDLHPHLDDLANQIIFPSAKPRAQSAKPFELDLSLDGSPQPKFRNNLVFNDRK
jgi:hypothetical protein